MERAEVQKRIEECELEGRFDVHVDPIPEELILPVDENYHYINDRTLFEKFKYFVQKIFIVKPFTLYENIFGLKTKVIGRENLKGLKAAVITCNHVAKFDCLAAKYALRGHRTFVVAAHFNNMKGFMGEMMRAGDMVPLNTTLKGTAKFNRTVDDILARRKKFLLVYPEAAMWYHYRKVRPYKDGAFHFAQKHGVPVVPMFITYREDPKKPQKLYYTVHIAKPIYAPEGLSKKERTEYLRDAAFAECKKIYEDTYGIPLTYTCDEN